MSCSSGKHAYAGVVFICFLFCTSLCAQTTPSEPVPSAQTPAVHIEVHADHETGARQPVWNYFGYDEPNYTYAPNGKKLLHELAALSPTPVHIRTHNLFTSGDGSASLKWGSTNVYSEDANGNPVYDWKIVDRIFDTYHEAGIKPLVELGFMPEALSVHPEPYRHNFPQGSIFTGWAYPPKDYGKWAELVFQFTKHLRERYGDAEVTSWLWEVWNEPDIPYWKGTREEYFKLYDYSSDAVKRALPGAHVGGPDATGPGSANAVEFLRAFLEHCAHGQNSATGKQGAPLDFVSFHPKGAPKFQDGHIAMGLRRHLEIVEQGFEIVKSFPEWKNTPVILGESDPEGCAACSPVTHPEDGYRNSSLYAAYTAETLNQIEALAARNQINFQGAVTWAFEFEGQPYFVGYRDLATNGIDKPVLNGFRMFGLLHGPRLEVSSSGAVSTDEILKSGVNAQPDVSAIATHEARQITVLVWNYHDEAGTSGPSPVALSVAGVAPGVERALVEHFRVDDTHSNAYSAWVGMGSPQSPSADELKKLESAGQLQLLTSPAWTDVHGREITLNFDLPQEGLSLVRISW
ncbi:MAG TPA: beta-xylosidase [Terriglobales bacterium]